MSVSVPGPAGRTADCCAKPTGSNTCFNGTWILKGWGSCLSLQDFGLWGKSNSRWARVSAAATLDESLTVQFSEARGGVMCRATFHICCLHMGNLTLLLSRRALEEPNKIISLCSRWLPSPPVAFLSCHPPSTLESPILTAFFFLPWNAVSFLVTSCLLCFVFHYELILSIQQQLYNL